MGSAARFLGGPFVFEVMTVIGKILAILLAICAVWFLLPMFLGVFHVGMFLPAAVLIALAAVGWHWDRVRPVFASRFARLAWGAVALAVAAGVAVAVPMVRMAAAARHAPEAESTVIVLGCQVRGSEPSRMLSDRCDAAAEYLRKHPNAFCVASGGQGEGEDISEAEAIRRALIERGIDEARILIEDRSTNTSENLAFSIAVLDANGIDGPVAIATDAFHQYRASYFAAANGRNASALSRSTYWPLAPGYWFREVLAVYKAWLLGY